VQTLPIKRLSVHDTSPFEGAGNDFGQAGGTHLGAGLLHFNVETKT